MNQWMNRWMKRGRQFVNNLMIERFWLNSSKTKTKTKTKKKKKSLKYLKLFACFSIELSILTMEIEVKMGKVIFGKSNLKNSKTLILNDR